MEEIAEKIIDAIYNHKPMLIIDKKDNPEYIWMIPRSVVINTSSITVCDYENRSWDCVNKREIYSIEEAYYMFY